MKPHLRFDCYSHDLLVGSSDLKCTDPPMGVAFGTFVPTPDYQTIQPRVRAANRDPRDYLAMEQLALTVRNVAGLTLQCAGVWLTDVADLGEDPELEVLGVVDFDENFPVGAGRLSQANAAVTPNVRMQRSGWDKVQVETTAAGR